MFSKDISLTLTSVFSISEPGPKGHPRGRLQDHPGAVLLRRARADQRHRAPLREAVRRLGAFTFL